MTIHSYRSPILVVPALLLASCAFAESGESEYAMTLKSQAVAEDGGYSTQEMGAFNEPWAIEFLPGTDTLAITEKSGKLFLMKTGDGAIAEVKGVPEVSYAGQGGLGDIAFLESEADRDDGRTIYISYAEAGEDETRGAALGRGTLVCVEETDDCSLQGFEVIWRQAPKVTGRGHYSHRIQISPDGQYLFVASGDRQKQDPAQDTTNNLGTIVRLNLDGTPASGNPMESEGGVTAEIWSYGHRNILGMDFDAEGRLWDTEHGPAGGDELNLVERGNNYGWPTRSFGDNYNGVAIEDHSADDGFTKPATFWTPVIAPGDMIIYSGDMFGPWSGDALITGLKTQALVRVELDGESAREVARYDFGARLRSVEQGPDGSIWVAEDGKDGRILKLTM